MTVNNPTLPAVAEIIDRRDQSKKWFRQNLFDEMTEVYRSLKCRTKPIFKKDANGVDTKEEDKSRTNVAMPDTNIVWRKNVARMTAQPYRVQYTGGNDPMVTEAMSALAMQQYMRSNEQWQDRRLVMQGEAFGFSYSKLYWDRLARTMMFRKKLVKGDQVVNRSRADVMKAQGAGQDEIDDAVKQMGDDLSDDEVAQYVGKTGNEIVVPTEINKYEGPCVKVPFVGDIFLEPGCLSLQDSNFVIEQYRETDLWIQKMLKLTYKDDSGQWVPAFDPDACQDMLDYIGEPATLDNRVDDLKQMFEASVGRTDEQQQMFPDRLRPRKKFDIIEQHALEDDGRIWITWVSERWREKPLGKMPYPWDLYGKYAYSEYVPLPDIIGPYGDSTPRLMRFLAAMRNLTVGQNFDYVTNLLKPLFLQKAGAEVDAEIITRGLFRVLKVEELNCLQNVQMPGMPQGAFERVADILRDMAMLEPALNTTDTGTDANPMAGKLATTAILNAKAADALLQFKIDGRELYIKDLSEKKLWMNQQARDDDWEIEREFWGQDLTQMVDEQPPAQSQGAPAWALSARNGKTVAIRLDPFEIQEDYQVIPEAASYLAVDDQIRQGAALQVQQVATANPGIIDQRKLARFQLSTIRGIDNPDDFILPPTPPAPPLKMNFNLQAKFDELPVEWQQALGQEVGLPPSQTLTEDAALKRVQDIGSAANAAVDMNSAAQDTNPADEKIGTAKQAMAT